MRIHRDCCVPEPILTVFQSSDLTAGTETHLCPVFPCDLFVVTILRLFSVLWFRRFDFRSVCFTLFLVPAIRDVLLCHFPHYLAFRHEYCDLFAYL